MCPINFNALEPCDDFLAHLGKSVWLMDDHRWAILVWEEQRKQEKYSLVHADYHWDAVYNFHEEPEEVERELLNADLARIKEYLIEDELIQFDSFIAPAVRRGLFDSVHFFCVQDDNGGDIGFDDYFLEKTGIEQVIHPSIDSLAAVRFQNPIIFDLCLDLFNRSDRWMEGDLWNETEIKDFLKSIRHIIHDAEIVTVSLSFNYSGTHDDTRALAGFVIPIVLSYRN